MKKTLSLTYLSDYYKNFDAKFRVKIRQSSLRGNGYAEELLASNQYNPICLLALKENKILGWCNFFPLGVDYQPTKAWPRLVAGPNLQFYVNARYRRRGIAKILAIKMLDYLKTHKIAIISVFRDQDNWDFFNWLNVYAWTNYQMRLIYC